MAVRFSKIWLLIGVVFTGQLPVTRGQLCPLGSTFHPQTGSCMALIRNTYSYINARSYCQNSFKSSKTNREGHLVFIFDKATDDVVKGLLDREDVDKALIGLNDRAQNGDYVWGDVNPVPANYTGWAVNPHTPDVNKRAVVMTKDGWQEYDDTSRNYFVCQVSADYPIPRMVCPVAEVGQESAEISCAIKTYQSLSIIGVRFMKAAAIVASCDADTCWSGLGYRHVVDVSKPPETDSSASWTLRLKNVTISDATDWTCSVAFNNNGDLVASQPCSLGVYRKPTDIQCSHQFVLETVRTTCKAAQVYPQVGCSWNIYYGISLLTVYDRTVSNDLDNTAGYYRATCAASFHIINTGMYNVTVAMVPRVPNFRIETVKETNVSVGIYQFTDPYNMSQIYKGQVNGAVSINVSVYGYPAPDVSLNSTKHILSSDAYTLKHTYLEPPYGIVSLVINIHNASFFQNYSLNIINTEGPLTYSFEIVEGDPVPENAVFPVQFVAATCIVAALIVIIIIVF